MSRDSARHRRWPDCRTASRRLGRHPYPWPSSFPPPRWQPLHSRGGSLRRNESGHSQTAGGGV